MGKVWAIALNTFKEAVRNRILYILLIFAIVLLLFSGAVRELTISSQEQVIRKLGLGCINVFGLLIAVFVGIGLVYNELDKKTIYTIVSKPIDRWQFILGKYFGLLLTIYVNILIMVLFFYAALYFQEYTSGERTAAFYASWGPERSPGALGHFGYLAKSVLLSLLGSVKTLFGLPDTVTACLQTVVLMTCIELAIITAFAILYSSFSTPTLSAILTVFTFVIGRCSEDIVRYSWYVYRKDPELATFAVWFKYRVAQFVAHVAPNLKIYYSDTSARALDALENYYSKTDYRVLSIPSVEAGWNPVLYGLAYSALILSLAVVVFRRRNFK